MRNFIVILAFLSGTACLADDYRRTLYMNALNMNAKQLKQAETFDETKYDDELDDVLNRKQCRKLREMQKLDRKHARRANKPLFKHDPNVRTFGMKEEYGINYGRGFSGTR